VVDEGRMLMTCRILYLVVPKVLTGRNCVVLFPNSGIGSWMQMGSPACSQGPCLYRIEPHSNFDFTFLTRLSVEQ
jgi:hypothetical protein